MTVRKGSQMPSLDSCELTIVLQETPSRHGNPFATCWTRPGALAFRFAAGQSTAQLVERLAAQNWRGAIIGPHGCGKSTLLETVKPALEAAGRRVQAVALHDGQRHLPRAFYNGWVSAKTVLFVDGYEQLGWIERWRLARRSRLASVGLLVTSHRPLHIPTLVCLEAKCDLVQQLVADLCAEVSTLITASDVVASHDCHGSNVREIFFDLYDRHERGRRLCVKM